MSNHDSSTDRRSFLTAIIVGGGTVALAGCTGGGSSERITIGTSASGTSADTGTQALQRAVNEHADGVQISPQTTGGYGSNPRLYDDGEIDACVIDQDTAQKAINDNAEFADNPIDEFPAQGFSLAAFEYHFYAREDTDIETTDDLRGRSIWPQPPDFGTRTTQEEVLQNAGLWEEVDVVNIGTGDLPGALEEERVDAFVAYGSNGIAIPSWAQEIDARANIKLVETTDNFQQAIKDTPGARFDHIEPYGWEQDIDDAAGSDIVSWILDALYYFDPDIDADAVYELARVSHEHNDYVQESEPTYPNHSDPGNMTNGVLPDINVHTGVAEYWRDVGVWDDSWSATGG